MTPEEATEAVTGDPLGRLVALQYRDVAQQPGGFPTYPVLRIHIRPITPTGTFHQDLPNTAWAVQCPALQFMALHDYQPSDIDGTYENVEDEQTVVGIAPAPSGDYWGLAQSALEDGETALREAEWFDGQDHSDDAGTEQQAAGGGSGDSDGGGKPTIEKADEDSDAGINVTVE